MKFYTCSCCILVAKPGGPTFSCGNSLRSSLGAGWADLASNELTGQNGQTNSHGPRPILCRFDRSVASFLSGSLGAGSADVGAHAPAPSLSLYYSPVPQCVSFSNYFIRCSQKLTLLSSSE